MNASASRDVVDLILLDDDLSRLATLQILKMVVGNPLRGTQDDHTVARGIASAWSMSREYSNARSSCLVYKGRR